MHPTNKAVSCTLLTIPKAVVIAMKQWSHVTPFCPLRIPSRCTNGKGQKRQGLQGGEEGGPGAARKLRTRVCGRLTCVDGTRVMVAEGAAFVVAAQGGACLLAVGTFLKGKEVRRQHPRLSPLPPGCPQAPLARRGHMSLWLQGSVVAGGAGRFPAATHCPHGEATQKQRRRAGLATAHKPPKRSRSGVRTGTWPCPGTPPSARHAQPAHPLPSPVRS